MLDSTTQEKRVVGTPRPQTPRLPDARPDQPTQNGSEARPAFRRRRYWIDSRSQLPVTVLSFFVVTFFVVMFNVVMMDLAEARREFIVDAVPSMKPKLEAQDRDLQRLLTVSSTLLVACVMAGVVVLTHRSAGPVRNVQNHMKRIAEGDLRRTVSLRRGDHFTSLADEMNTMILALRERAEEDAMKLERLAARARTGADPQGVASELEDLADAKRVALPS